MDLRLSKSLQTFATNPVDPSTDQAEFVCCIIGANPSSTARSPLLWNAAFKALGWNARFAPLDLPPERLEPFLRFVRGERRIRGLAVAFPYKSVVLPLMDRVDPMADRIGAANVIAADAGRLTAYNTDAAGFMASLVRPSDAGEPAVFPELAGRRALVIGAGGAARAVAFSLAEKLGSHGALSIANRTFEGARSLANAVARHHGNATALAAHDLREAAPDADLIVNASLRGQAGLRKVPDGVTCLEPYSCLAPANPAVLPAELAQRPREFQRAWFRASRQDLEENWTQSSRVLAALRPSTVLVDLIFQPAETRFLIDGRLSGLVTANGRSMNLWQAVLAFTDHVLPNEISRDGRDVAALRTMVARAMREVR